MWIQGVSSEVIAGIPVLLLVTGTGQRGCEGPGLGQVCISVRGFAPNRDGDRLPPLPGYLCPVLPGACQPLVWQLPEEGKL